MRDDPRTVLCDVPVILRPRTPDDDELAAAVGLATFLSDYQNDVSARTVVDHAARNGLLAVDVRWWLADSNWFDADARRTPRRAWAISVLGDVEQVIGWLVPQAKGWELLIAEPPADRGGAAVKVATPGFEGLFGTRRGISPREQRQRLAGWLVDQDHDALARRTKVPGAEDFDRKAQGAWFETMFDEKGFAYELYPRAQKQRYNLNGLVVMFGVRRYALFVRPQKRS